MMMTTSRAWGSPSRYIQGPDEIKRLSAHTSNYGKKVIAIIDEFFYDNLSNELAIIYKESQIEIKSIKYHTEITKERIEEFSNLSKEFQAEVILGIGGGKSIDISKCVAGTLNLPLIIIPTSASTDAPTSAMSIIYNDKHQHSDVWYFKKNPDLVLIDSTIVANAPIKFLVAGMGDAIATYFEGKASVKTNNPNYINNDTGFYRPTNTAIAIAELCYTTILENGVKAKLSNELRITTESLEAVIEANTLMSGLGFENVGCCGSHAICNGITNIPQGAKLLHGEKVAFGVLCQLVAENSPLVEIENLMNFYTQVGLPITLEDMNIQPTEENFKIISTNTQKTEWTKESFYIDDSIINSVVKLTNSIGLSYKEKLYKI